MRIGWLLLVSFFSTFAGAQTYGNEWISYNQKYFSFPVVESGIYKIDYSTLISAGVPLSSLSSSNLQIYGKEKEIPLHIEDGGDETIENGDFILFYAERNDGWLDSTLYDNEEWIGNPKYSLYNDTLQYFLTWNSTSDNFRFIQESSVDFENYIADDFVVEETFNFYSNSYNEGEKSADASSSFYMPGEGWGSTPKNGSAGYTWDFGTLNFIGIYQGSNAPLIDYESVVVGRSNAAQTTPGSGNHHTRHTIGNNNFV